MVRIRRKRAVRIIDSKQREYNRKLRELSSNNSKEVLKDNEKTKIENAVIDIGFKNDIFEDEINDKLNIFDDDEF